MSEKYNPEKRIELLRLFVNEGNFQETKEIAKKLGISSSSYFKIVNELNEFLYTDKSYLQLGPSDALKQIVLKKENHTYAIYKLIESILPTKSRVSRYAVILKLLQRYGELTVTEVVEHASFINFPNMHKSAWERKEASRCLDDLTLEGLVLKKWDDSRKPGRSVYRLAPSLHELSTEAKEQLSSYLQYLIHRANRSLPAHSIQQKLLKVVPVQEDQSIYYHYHYIGRMLDEPIVELIQEAIRTNHTISFQYFEVKSQKKVVVKKSKQSLKKTVIPLRIVYDEQFYRWYLIGKSIEEERERLFRYRLDYMIHTKITKPVDEPVFLELLEQCKNELASSWLVSDSPLEKIKVRFKQDPTSHRPFIRERVERQGQHGRIVEELEDGSFIWEIEVAGVDEIIPWVRSFGRSAKVIEPVHLRERMIADLQEVLSIYGYNE